MPIKCTIGGVDVSTALKGISAQPGGDGLVGSATLILDQLSGGMDLRPYMEVRCWVTFDASGAGVASKGRLFGGLVATRTTGNHGVTKTWSLKCSDYNLLLHRIVRDAASTKSITLTAGTFAAQIIQLTTIIQQNGLGTVNTQIDATTGVVSLYATMPGVTYEGGHPYGWYIQQLCNTAQSLNSALNPHFYMGTTTTFGVGDTFGTPVLNIFDGASLPAIGLSFSDVIAGGRKGYFGTFKRTTDATQTIQRKQAFFSSSHVIATSANATSQGLYPNPFINHGGASNTGYWMEEVSEDSVSTTFAAAQAELDRQIAVQSIPGDTFEFDTEERVLPGDMIGLGNALEGIADDTPYRVVKVTTTVGGAEVINSHLTVNSRRLGLFDDGQAVFALPVEGDIVPPLAPASFTLTANYYDGATGDANLIFAIGASPSPDVVGYAIRGRVGHAAVSVDVGTTLAPALIFPSGLPYTFDAVAYDRKPNYSEPTTPDLTGTTAVPVYDFVPNPDFDAFDRVDITLPYHWTRSVANGGTATWDNTNQNTGAGCFKLTTTSTGGSTASGISSMTVVKGPTYGEVFSAKASSGTPNLTAQYDWYDSAQAFISSTSFVSALTTSYARKTGPMTRPAGAAYFKVKYTNSASNVTIYVDTTDHQPQLPTVGLEAGAVTPDKTAFNVDTGGVPLPFNDENALPIAKIGWIAGAPGWLRFATFNGDPGHYTTQGLRFQGGVGSASTFEMSDSLIEFDSGGNTQVRGGNFRVAANSFFGGTATTPTAFIHAGAGTTGVSPLKLTSGTNLSTPEAGAIEYDGSALYATPVVDRHNIVTASTPIVTSVSVGNTGTETLVFTGSVSANELKVARTIVLKAWGHYINGLGRTETGTLRVKLAGTAVFNVALPSPGTTARPVYIEYALTIRTTGASGTYWHALHSRINSVVADQSITAVPNIDTTVAEDVTVTYQWSAGGASNNFVLDMAWMEIIH